MEESIDDDRRHHFFSVASRSSNEHMSYRRDLVMLLNLSLLINENDLALDLGTLFFRSYPF